MQGGLTQDFYHSIVRELVEYKAPASLSLLWKRYTIDQTLPLQVGQPVQLKKTAINHFEGIGVVVDVKRGTLNTQPFQVHTAYSYLLESKMRWLNTLSL